MRQKLKSRLRTIARPQNHRPARARGPRDAVVIAIAAHKGGVGKTTTAVNLGASLAEQHGLRVLIIDLDPQGHINTALSQSVTVGGGAITDALTVDGTEVIDIVTSTQIKGMDVTPLDQNLAQTENLINTRIGKEYLLRESIQTTRTFYDVILIDCPPNLGNLTINGLVAADQVIIPCDPSPLALSGVHSVAEAIEAVATRLNPEIDILGVLLTRVDGRNTTLNEAVLAEARESFGDALMPLQIGINNALAKAQHAGQDIFSYAPESRGAEHYQALGAWVSGQLNRIKNQ
jgi:chromosome partitioning protein